MEQHSAGVWQKQWGRQSVAAAVLPVLLDLPGGLSLNLLIWRCFCCSRPAFGKVGVRFAMFSPERLEQMESGLWTECCM